MMARTVALDTADTVELEGRVGTVGTVETADDAAREVSARDLSPFEMTHNAIYSRAGTRMSQRADQYEQDDAAHLSDRLKQLRDEFDAATRNTARYGSPATSAGFEFEALRCELDRLRAALTDLQHSTHKQAASTCVPAESCAPAGAAAPPYPPFPPYPPYPPAPPFPPFPPYPPNCGCCAPAPCGCSKCRPTEAKPKVVQPPETPVVPPSSSSSSNSSGSSIPGAVGVVYYAQAQTSSSASYDPNALK